MTIDWVIGQPNFLNEKYASSNIKYLDQPKKINLNVIRFDIAPGIVLNYFCPFVLVNAFFE